MRRRKKKRIETPMLALILASLQNSLVCCLDQDVDLQNKTSSAGRSNEAFSSSDDGSSFVQSAYTCKLNSFVQQIGLYETNFDSEECNFGGSCVAVESDYAGVKVSQAAIGNFIVGDLVTPVNLHLPG
jgi:hypothetical protein